MGNKMRLSKTYEKMRQPINVIRGWEMHLWVKGLAVKADDPSFIPKSHLVE